MNRSGELSNKYNTIVAINFESIFSKKPSLKDMLLKDKLTRTFNTEYKDLTYRLYKKGFNVYITSFSDITKYENVLWGRFLFYNKLVVYGTLGELAFDCRNIYSYYIDDISNLGLLDNCYSLQQFKELI